MSKDSFVLYNDMYELIKYLDDEMAGKLIKAIFEYTINKTIPDEKNIMAMFMFIKNKIDKDTKKYEVVCERNRINGEKGGRPREPKKPSGLLINPSEPKKADNDNEYEYDINNQSKDMIINNKKENVLKEKNTYGEFENVKLTDEEFKKLMDKFPNDYLDKIDRLSSYIASKGVRYKSHYATILNWARKDDIISKPKTRREKEEEFWAKIDKEIEDEERGNKESN